MTKDPNNQAIYKKALEISMRADGFDSDNMMVEAD